MAATIASKAAQEAAETSAKIGVNVAEDIAKRIAKEGVESVARELAEKSVRETTEKIIKESGEKLTKETFEKLVQEATEKLVKEGGGKISREIAEKIARESIEKASKETLENVSKKTLKNQLDNIVDNLAKSGEKVTKESLEVVKDKTKNMLEQVTDFIKKNPKAILGGLTLAGFALYCVITNQSPGQAAGTIAKGVTKEMAKAINEVADGLGITDQVNAFYTFVKWFGFSIAIILLLYLMWYLYKNYINNKGDDIDTNTLISNK